MKYYRKALPVGSGNLDEAFTICFDETCVREFVDKDGNPINVASLPVNVQNSIAEWEDAFEDGYNQFDGTFEFWPQYDGSMLRRRAWKVDEVAE